MARIFKKHRYKDSISLQFFNSVAMLYRCELSGFLLEGRKITCNTAIIIMNKCTFLSFYQVSCWNMVIKELSKVLVSNVFWFQEINRILKKSKLESNSYEREYKIRHTVQIKKTCVYCLTLPQFEWYVVKNQSIMF